MSTWRQDHIAAEMRGARQGRHDEMGVGERKGAEPGRESQEKEADLWRRNMGLVAHTEFECSIDAFARKLDGVGGWTCVRE